MSSNLIKSDISINNNNNLKNCKLQNKYKDIGKADLPALMIRQEIFETATVDNESYLKSLDNQDQQSPQLTSKKKIDKSVLLRSIENIMQYFDKEISLSETSGKSTPDIPPKQGRVATAVANWSNLRISHSNTSKNPNCKLSSNKVRQLTKMFNNKISQLMQKNTIKQPENIKSQTTVNCTTPKFRRKTATFLTAFASPKASPKLRRRKLQKAISINTLSNRQFRGEQILQKLTVKDRVLLYEKFDEDLPNHCSKLHKISTLVKDGYVKQLRTELETRLNEPLAGLARTNSGKIISTGEDTDSYASNESTSITRSSTTNGSLNDDSSADMEDCLHVSRLAVVLKPNTKSKTTALVGKSKKHYKQSPLLFAKHSHSIPSAETPNEIHKSTKKNRRAYYNRLLAKIMPQQQQQQQQPEQQLIYEQKHVKQLFQKWLEEKNGVIFDIVPVTETIHKSEAEQLSSDNRSDTHDVLSLIKETLNKKVHDNSVIELELPLEDDQHTIIPSNNSLANPKQTDNNCNTSSISKSIKSENLMLNTLQTQEKLHRFSYAKQEDSAIECQNQLSEDSDFDFCKTPSEHLIASTPNEKIPQNRSNHIKQLIFHSDNNSVNGEEPKLAEANDNIINKINQSMSVSTSLTHTDSNISDNELPKNPPNSLNSTLNATHSNSYPSLIHLNAAAINSDRTQSALRKFAEADFDVQNNLIDSFIDQGFETGSNATCSPSRSDQFNLISMYLTPNIIRNLDKMDEIQTDISSINDPSDNYKILTVEQKTPASLHTATKGYNQTSKQHEQIIGNISTENSDSDAKIKVLNQFGILNNENTNLRATNRKCSQFWISTGLHSISATIEFYDPSHLAILSRIFSKASIKFGEMNFGIDDQRFSYGNRTSPDELIKRIPKIPNLSQYWFSTGNILIHFRGNLMNKNKIRKFFGYIQEFIDESGTLRFGIDSYDFSNTTSTTPLQSQQNHERIRAKKILYKEPIYSTDSLSSEPSTDFSNTQFSSDIKSNSSSSLESNNLPKDRNDIDAKMEIIERLKNKCQLIERSMRNDINACNYPATRIYWRNMQKMVANIHDISRGTGFKHCSTDQLAVFMNVLSNYADFSLKACSQQTEQILNTISTQIESTDL